MNITLSLCWLPFYLFPQRASTTQGKSKNTSDNVLEKDTFAYVIIDCICFVLCKRLRTSVQQDLEDFMTVSVSPTAGESQQADDKLAEHSAPFCALHYPQWDQNTRCCNQWALQHIQTDRIMMGITIFEHQTISQLSFTLKQPESESCKLCWKRSCKTSVQMSNWNIFIFLQVSWMLTWCCTSCAVTESWRAFAFAGRDFLIELFMPISNNGKKSYYWRILCTLENIKNCTMNYNPNSRNVGTFINLNKMKTKRLSNHMSQYFIHNRT